QGVDPGLVEHGDVNPGGVTRLHQCLQVVAGLRVPRVAPAVSGGEASRVRTSAAGSETAAVPEPGGAAVAAYVLPGQPQVVQAGRVEGGEDNTELVTVDRIAPGVS